MVKVDEIVTRLIEEVSNIKDQLLALSHKIHSFAELAFKEYQSSSLIKEILAKAGFEIYSGPSELPTAFKAKSGGENLNSSAINIGIFAEYDALPEVGHACGHNIIAASAVGAALLAQSYARTNNFNITLYGTPAEESGGGKILLQQKGFFTDTIAGIMVHPGRYDSANISSKALIDWRINFKGKAAHAAAAPTSGVNAADAAMISQVALGLLRQQLPVSQQLHGIILDGGVAANIIPAETQLAYYFRAENKTELMQLAEKARNCFAAGALATGCDYAIAENGPAYYEMKTNSDLASIYHQAISCLNRTPVSLNDAPPFLGSTDMGNISYEIPSLQAMIKVGDGNINIHEVEFAKTCITESGDKAVIDGAVALAAVAIAIGTNPELQQTLLNCKYQN